MNRVPAPHRLLRFHLECLQGLYFSELHTVPGGWLAFSDQIKDPYYNLLVPTESGPTDWRDVRDEFTRRGRIPTVYDAFGSEAPAGNRHVWARDAWMITATAAVPAQPTVSNVTLTLAGVQERGTYVGAFERAYAGDDPTEPYGKLDPAYLDCLSSSFQQETPGYRRHYLLASVGQQAVGVATLFTAHDLAAIYGIGTVPEWRGNGIGAALLHYAGHLASQDHADYMFLQTEADSPVEAWYRRRGYQRIFVAPYLTER